MIPHAPVDPRTAALLDLIAGDPIHESDRDIVEEGVREVARLFDGEVDPNVLREWLRDEHGNCVVYPAVIGATVNAMKRRGDLIEDGWVITEGSTTGNNGKPARRYRLTDRTAA